jgi:thymidylate kinase
MIIELIGPPGAGKTTFAHALTNRLRERGHVVELTLSYRPAECSSSPDPCSSNPAERRAAAVVRRLSRPLLEMLAIVRHPFTLSHDIGAASGLMKILPPRNMVEAIRLTQYMLRLSHSWGHASTARNIVLFDQAFVQLVCSLVLLGRTVDESLIARALSSTPKSDLLIRLDAPTEVLAARLRDRQCRQSGTERLLELDVGTNLESIRIIDHLHGLMENMGQSVITASSLDQRALCRSVEHIEKRLAMMFGAESWEIAS